MEVLRKGARFEILESGDWLRIRLPDRRVGYISYRAQVRIGGPEVEKAECDAFAPERAGIRMGMAGGLLMMGIAAVWFFLGLAFDYLFYYPPILFVIGLYAFFKGLVTGNLAGGRIAVDE